MEYYYWDLKKMNIKQNSFFKKNLLEFSIDTSKGPISCLQAKNKNSKKWVIGLHGWTEDKYLALRLTSHFYDNGYNILTFDSFAHVKTYGENTDIGFSSIEIINSIINFLKTENDISVIGLIGNSMGASTSILYSQVGKYNVNWVVAVCGFSDIKTQYRYYVQNNF
ncbi:alpha/beta fold hydrolase [Spiroplasma endosymbiont of Atherix ibis]|uniref:alpha/beta fold hydrolase n=1 Tax=Spiroplasma endosymbiont of Atherix ibis TaxID=3066291 RepID=UPI0030D066E1